LGTDLGSEFQLLFPSTPLLFQSIDLKLNSSLLLIAQALGFKAVDGHSGRNHGVSITPMTINPSNQTRSDSKAGYIDPLPPRSNLFVPPSTLPVNLLLLYRWSSDSFVSSFSAILTGYQATAVTFNGTKDANGSAIASGLEFMSTAGGAQGTKYTVTATKEVILAYVFALFRPLSCLFPFE
jgi:choline dehydrogenase